MDTSALVHELMATLHSVHRNMRCLDASSNADCVDMSHLQMHTLLMVREHGSCSMKELADSQRIVPATMTALVDRLVKKGMLDRTADPEDRRSIRVSLSQQGKDLLEKFYHQKVERATMMLGILDLEEQKILVNLMKKIDKHFLTLIDEKK